MAEVPNGSLTWRLTRAEADIQNLEREVQPVAVLVEQVKTLTKEVQGIREDVASMKRWAISAVVMFAVAMMAAMGTIVTVLT